MSKQDVEQIPLSNRRLDSLALILRGDNTVAAATIDENELLMAFNFCPSSRGRLDPNFFKKKQSDVWHGEDIFSAIKKHLMCVAKSSKAFVDSVNRPEDTQKLVDAAAVVGKPEGPKAVLTLSLSLAKRYSAHKKECQESLVRLEEAIKRLSEFIHNHRGFRDSVQRALVKVTRSVRHAYLYPGTEKAIDENVKNAIEQGNIRLILPTIKDFPGQNYHPSREIHAEMAILNDLIVRGRIQEGRSFYMGVSKKCCFTCEVAVNAVNNIFKSKIMEEEGEGTDEVEDEESSEDDVISIRGGHSYIFPSVPPPFLSANEDLKNEFLRLFKEKLKGLIGKNRFLVGSKVVSTAAHIDQLQFVDVFLLAEEVLVDGKAQVHSPSNSKEGFSTFDSSHSGRYFRGRGGK